MKAHERRRLIARFWLACDPTIDAYAEQLDRVMLSVLTERQLQELVEGCLREKGLDGRVDRRRPKSP